MSIILALDPGKTNFAYVVLEIDDKKTAKAGRLVGVFRRRGIINCTLRSLSNRDTERSETAAYREAIRGILAEWPVNAVIAERYMLRRGAGGNTIELVNQMLGMLRLIPGVELRMIPASQWKNAANSSGSVIEDLYAKLNAVGSVLKTQPGRITVHECDAAHIAVYEALHRAEFPYDDFDLVERVADIESTHIGDVPETKKRRKRKPA